MGLAFLGIPWGSQESGSDHVGLSTALWDSELQRVVSPCILAEAPTTCLCSCSTCCLPGVPRQLFLTQEGLAL